MQQKIEHDMNQDVAIFEKLFNTYYSGLVVYASRFTKDTAVAEDIVSDVFASVWENRSVLYLENTKSYLFSAVRNRSLNYLEQLKVRDDYQEEAMRKGEASGSLTWEYYVEGELREAIDKAIDTLPPQCKKVFTESRFKHKNVDEIARELDLSPRTVEKHIEVALKKLRVELQDYLPAAVLTWLLTL